MKEWEDDTVKSISKVMKVKTWIGHVQNRIYGRKM